MTRTILLRTLTGLGLLSLLSAAAHATPGNENTSGTLTLDGRVLAEGGLDHTSLTVLRDGKEQRHLSSGLKEFTMELALGHTYTLVFRKPGCVTKELLFDTRTESASTYQFRFQVALNEALGAGEYSYDGPVAIIRFDAQEGEFDYDRQHTTPQLLKAAPRPRREGPAFVDPTTDFAAWVEEKRKEQLP